MSVGLSNAKDSLAKLVKAIGKDPELAPSFATAFINTFTGGVDMTGEFNAWGDKLNKVINNSDKSSVASGIRRIEAITGKAALNASFKDREDLASIGASFKGAKNIVNIINVLIHISQLPVRFILLFLKYLLTLELRVLKKFAESFLENFIVGFVIRL